MTRLSCMSGSAARSIAPKFGADAVPVLEIYGPVITEALRQLDRATTVAWKAVNLAEVTDDEWQLVKHAIGIDRGWDGAYRLVSSLDLAGQDTQPDWP
jgi:hypothetical protein